MLSKGQNEVRASNNHTISNIDLSQLHYCISLINNIFVSFLVDNHFVQSIVNFLLTDGNLGIDLIALNTQRGRDHGLPGYTQYRKACNVGDAKTFDDLASNVSPKNIERLKSVYQSVDDIDLFIGMAAEEPENALVGNTYRCLIADQFARLKKGDRYFYDLEGQAGSFSPGIHNEIFLFRLN